MEKTTDARRSNFTTMVVFTSTRQHALFRSLDATTLIYLQGVTSKSPWRTSKWVVFAHVGTNAMPHTARITSCMRWCRVQHATGIGSYNLHLEPNSLQQSKKANKSIQIIINTLCVKVHRTSEKCYHVYLSCVTSNHLWQ